MGTVVKDEAAILKALGKNPKGTRSTDLWFAVRRSVRSLTTFQKRLKHLKEMGRIQTKNDDLDDRRVTIITPTELSRDAQIALNAIDLLTRLYLGKTPRSQVKVIKGGTVEEVEGTAYDLLAIAHKTFKETALGEVDAKFGFDDPLIWVTDDNDVNIMSHPMNVYEEWRADEIERAILDSPEMSKMMKERGFSILEGCPRYLVPPTPPPLPPTRFSPTLSECMREAGLDPTSSRLTILS